MMTQEKERTIQATIMLMLITTILLSFLCFNAYAAGKNNISTLPKNGGSDLTSLALTDKMNSFIGSAYNTHFTP